MASIKVKYRPSAVDDREGSIYYQIIHDRKVGQLNSGCRVMPEEWDAGRSTVTAMQTSGRKSFILSVRERIRHDVERLSKIVRTLEAESLTYTTDDVIDEFKRYANEYSLFNYMEAIILKLRLNGKMRTSETYSAALNSFRKFRNGEDIEIDRLTPEMIESYEDWHRSKGNLPNTVSFYCRILRAVYNRAVENGIIEHGRNPFRRVYTGIDKTVKRALPLCSIKAIKSLDLSRSPQADFARDMFMMSFCLRGMSFIDMAFLRKCDLKNGQVVYRRRKTGQRLTIGWTVEMQQILDKYPKNPTEYLLPIIKSDNVDKRYAYRNAGYNINRNLKKVAEMVGIKIPLTLYVARHSWASAAKAKGIPLSVISEGLGHDSEATTKIYLACLETSVVDEANSIILKSIE